MSSFTLPRRPFIGNPTARGLFDDHVGPRAPWHNVSPRRVCGLCGRPDWCSYTEDGWQTCRRPSANAPTGLLRYDSRGAPFLLVPPSTAAPPRPASRAPKKRPEDVPAAAAGVLDAAYRALLDALELDLEDREALDARGLDPAFVEAGLYRTLSAEFGARRRAFDCAAAAARAAGGDPAAVPGLDAVARTVRGRAGILVPVRDHLNRIAALLVRATPRAVAEGAPKYSFCSTKGRGGASPGAPCHVPAGIVPAPTVRVTEGALKADVATALSGLPTLGLSGVHGAAGALDALRALGASEVVLAFDADARTNRDVATAAAKAARTFRAAGLRVSVERWSVTWKGVDDALLNGARFSWLAGPAAEAALLDDVRAATPARPEPDPGEVQAPARKGKVPLLTHADRGLLRSASALATGKTRSKGLAAAAECGRFVVLTSCGSCGGADGARALVSERPACPHCGAAYVLAVRDHAAETWPAKLVVATATTDDLSSVGARRLRDRLVRALPAAVSRRSRRLVFPGGAAILTAELSDVGALAAAGCAVEELPREEAAARVAELCGRRNERIVAHLAAGDADALAGDDWLDRVVTTSAGRSCTVPWPSLDDLRARASRLAAERRAKDGREEGKSACCGAPLAQQLVDVQRGITLARRMPGSFPFAFKDAFTICGCGSVPRRPG